MEVHYEINGAFIEEGQLFKPENIAKIKHIPCKSHVTHHFSVQMLTLFQALLSKAATISCARPKQPGTYTKRCQIRNCI